VSPYPDARLIAGVAPPLDTTGEVPVTAVTVPLFVAAILIEPLPFVIAIPEPAVNVVFVNVLPVVFPISN